MPDYVPVKDRATEKHAGPIVGISCPWFLGRTRKNLENFYPGPTIMMHKLHYTEWIFILNAILTVVLTGLAMIGMIPLAAVCGLLSFISLTGLSQVWGMAKLKNLADLAGQLEDTAMENHEQINAVTAINDEWEQGLESSRSNLNEFTESLGFIGDDASKIDEVQQALSNLVKQKKEIQKEEKAIFRVSLKHQRVSRAEIEEKQRGIMKSCLSRVYDRLDRNGDGSGVLDSPDEIAALKTQMQKDDFLNKCSPDGQRLYHWEKLFDEIAEDGVVEKYELLDTLDTATEAFFIEIAHAIEEREELKAKLRERMAKKTD